MLVLAQPTRRLDECLFARPSRSTGPGDVSADCVAQDRDDPLLVLAQPTRRLDAPSTPRTN
ncbi:hypothetical protein [Streptomyces sp. NPDC102476]|uniref:hypothetical protein n=1 Tax=Streptomyces sp. NPDC102476 TaxID=3366181 RepID=UPI00382F5DEF